MFADIVDYTALMARSAEARLRVRERHRSVLRPVALDVSDLTEAVLMSRDLDLEPDAE